MFNINAGKEIWPHLGQALEAARTRRPSFLLNPPSPASFDFLNANLAVECADRVYPSGRPLLGALVGAHVATAPLLGPPIGLGPPTYDHNHAPTCAQWPARRPSRYEGSYRAAGSAPILVLGTTGDPDTPYRDAVALAGTLDNGHLLTFAAEGHTAYNRSECVSTLVTAYLATLALPARGTVCADETPPDALGRNRAGIEVDETRDRIPTPVFSMGGPLTRCDDASVSQTGDPPGRGRGPRHPRTRVRPVRRRARRHRHRVRRHPRPAADPGEGRRLLLRPRRGRRRTAVPGGGADGGEGNTPVREAGRWPSRTARPGRGRRHLAAGRPGGVQHAWCACRPSAAQGCARSSTT